MHEILKRLQPADRVLDLGCAFGSFRPEDTAATTFRGDLDAYAGAHFPRFVRCDARALPFADEAFRAVILNHSLEHFEKPETVLAELRRVTGSEGYLYIAVPDASTLTDRIYRWLGRGGGHVNRFTDPTALARMIEQQTGLRHTGTRVLFSSLSFLNRNNSKAKRPRRIYLLGGGWEWTLRVGMFLLRTLDRLAGTRTSVYGWAFGFGGVGFDRRAWSNVCVRCGSGHSSEGLTVRRGWLGIRMYACPACGTKNYFTEDGDFQ